MNQTKKIKARPSCYGCLHFKITWEQGFPYACKLYEFKSRNMPRFEIKKNSGADCLSYHKKNK